MEETHTELILGFCIPLKSGLTPPCDGFHLVFYDAASFTTVHAKLVLCPSVSLLGSLEIPAVRRGNVRCNAETMFEHNADIEL